MTQPAEMKPLTEERLREIGEREKAATDGPWPETCLRLVAFKRMLRRSGAQRYEEDVAFIAHAREDIPALIAEVQRLRGEVKDWKQAWRQAFFESRAGR